VRCADQAQRRAEGLREGGDGPGDGDPAGPGVGRGDLQAEPAEHVTDQREVGRIGAVLRFEFAAAERRRSGDELGRQILPAAGDQRHLDPGGVVQVTGGLGVGDGPPLAAGQGHKRILGHDGLP
jgi:hypothetical protein